MSSAQPPTTVGPLTRREARLAWGLLSPTLFSVALVVILPLLAIFWISFKPVQLSDLRPTTPEAYERIRGDLENPGDEAILEYRLSNSSREQGIRDVRMTDVIPQGLTLLEVDERCQLDGDVLTCVFGDWEPGFRERMRMPVTADEFYINSGVNPRATEAKLL
ncbi:MAG: sugar ABC transporter permease, partial [Verrucomicrobiota bacterium]